MNTTIQTGDQLLDVRTGCVWTVREVKTATIWLTNNSGLETGMTFRHVTDILENGIAQLIPASV